MSKHIYLPGSGLDQTEQVFDSLFDKSRVEGTAILDSASAGEVSKSFIGSEDMPERMRKLLDKVEDDAVKARVVRSVLDGVSRYEQAHGVRPSADILDSAIAQGFAAAHSVGELGIMDGVGSTSNHDPISAQPNRIVVAITSAIAEAIPFATYLPADIGSNESLLGIVSHQAASTFGAYAQGALLDGINVGDSYVSSERRVQLTLDAERDAATGGIFTTAGGSTTVRLLRGRSMVFVNGFPAGAENPKVAASVANSPISGSVVIEGTTYTVGGTVAVATGAFNLTFSPALPVGSVVHAEGHIDYERQTDLTPEILTQVQTYSLYASPWRVLMRQTPDSQTQYTNEISLDLLSESLIAARNQVAMERHYAALRKLMALAVNNSETYDFNVDAQIGEKTRAMIWQDFSAILGIVDQQMAEDTMDHGITHMYVTKNVAAQLLALPSTLFVPSGLVARPGIYRLGTLFGRFEVYYTPKVLTETADTSQILCIGRSAQVARCPIVLGDAVPLTIIPLAVDGTLRRGNGLYARNFTQVNPHEPSARGAALINVTNLF